MSVDLRDALAQASRSELARRRLLDFAQLVNPQFQAPRHILYLADLLERVERGEIKRLAISAPPGHGKSVLLQTFVAWFLGRKPERSILTISASESLAKRNSRDTQAIVVSESWPWSDVTLANDSVLEWRTNHGGEVRAIGKGGVVTGFRASGGIVVDDLQSDAGSDATRVSDFEWFRAVLSTRLEPEAWAVIIQTKWSDSDILGMIRDGESADQWLFVNLPAIAIENDVLGRSEGEALWPRRWPIEKLEAKKSEVGASVFASLYQGDPVPAGGAIFKAEWFENRYDVQPDRYVAFRAMAIDGAFSERTTADPSALGLWATDGGCYYLLESLARRLSFPDLVSVTVECYRRWRPHIVIVEQASSGLPLIQTLARETSIPITGVVPRGDKLSRIQSITPLFETGKIKLPKSAPFLESWEHEHSRFPHGKNDDQCDVTAIALTYLAEMNMQAEIERRRSAQWANFSLAR
jgi:predicted phage terminase large subunit-like protein